LNYRQLLTKIEDDCSEYLEMLPEQSKDKALINMLAKMVHDQQQLIDFLNKRLQVYDNA
jgi:hypothetical protein